jgi:hypothetical protein
LKAAVAERDLEGVKAAVQKYVKAVPDTTYVQLEQAFRTQNLRIYLIAIRKELAATYTNMDLQGNLDREFSVTWRWSDRPSRPREQDLWPTSANENSQRLAQAGEAIDRGLPKCNNWWVSFSSS